MRSLSILALLAMLLLGTPVAQADRRTDSQGHVVHTRMAPVLLHRAVPPFKGVHVYQGSAAKK